MKLNLKRPIVFFDLETTGVDTARDRIVEISMIKVMPDGEEITRTRRLNPGMHIPAEATAVHGITDDDVKECPTFAQVAKSLEQFIRGCDFGGFNSNRFDLPVLVEEFLRAGVDVDLKKRKFIDVQNIFHKKEQRTLVAAYRFYCDKDLDDAHSAEADTRATYEVLKAQLDRYPDLENDVAALADFSARGEAADYAGRILYNDKGEEVFGFGKYKGRSVAEIFRLEPSYYAWMMNGDFPLYTKKGHHRNPHARQKQTGMKRLCTLLLLAVWSLSVLAADKSRTIVYINGAKYYIHTVQAGETLYGLSKLYGVSEKGDPGEQPRAERRTPQRREHPHPGHRGGRREPALGPQAPQDLRLPFRRQGRDALRHLAAVRDPGQYDHRGQPGHRPDPPAAGRADPDPPQTDRLGERSRQPAAVGRVPAVAQQRGRRRYGLPHRTPGRDLLFALAPLRDHRGRTGGRSTAD